MVVVIKSIGSLLFKMRTGRKAFALQREGRWRVKLRSTLIHLSNISEQSHDHIARLALSQNSCFAMAGLVAVSQFEFRDKYWAILLIALALAVGCKTRFQDFQGPPYEVAVFISERAAEARGDNIWQIGGVLEAINQVVRILAFDSIVKRIRFEAGEA